MTTEEFPTIDFKNALTDLVLDDGLGRVPTVSGESRSVVQSGLERAIVDTPSLRDYLGYLDHNHRVRHPFKHSELLSSERVVQILADGLDSLTNAELAELALSPLQLMDISDQLGEQEPSKHWLQIIWLHNPEAALLSEVFDEHREELDAIFAPTKSPSRSRELVAAFGDDDDSSSPTVPAEPTVGTSWHKELPLNGPNVKWLEVIDAAKAQADRQRLVRIDFQWQQHSPSLVLSVRLGTPLLLAGQCCGQVWLLDAAGQTVAEGKPHETEFHVELAPDDRLRVRQLKVIYDRPGKYRIQVKVPLLLD